MEGERNNLRSGCDTDDVSDFTALGAYERNLAAIVLSDVTH